MALLKITLVKSRRYELENISVNPITISIYNIATENFPNNSTIPSEYILENYPLAVGQIYTVTFESDAIYGINVADAVSNIFESYVIYDYLDLRKCAENLIIKILCADSCCNDCKEDDRYTLNKMLALFQTYFMYLQREYGGFNTFFESLSPSRLEELFTITSYMELINKNCKSTGCVDEHTTSNCGACK